MEDSATDSGLSSVCDSRLDAALQNLVPEHVTAGVRRIQLADEVHLFDAERHSIRNAVRQRRAEFATGRFLLRSLSGVNASIPIGPTRAPIMPTGWVGSVSHDQTFVVAAVANTFEFEAIGIDIEPAGPLEADLADVVLRPEERHLDARLTFVLKEAAYKVWSGLGGRLLEFDEVSIATDGHAFRALVRPSKFIISGSFELVDDRWLALAAVRSGLRET